MEPADSTTYAALTNLYAAALPTDVPGAWIRDAIERMRSECPPAPRPEDAQLVNWPLDALLDALCELATLAREQLYGGGSIDCETRARILAVRAEIDTRARVAHYLRSAV